MRATFSREGSTFFNLLFPYHDPEGPICHIVSKGLQPRLLARGSLALLLINRQIYTEISPIIFQNVEPTLSLDDYLPIGNDGSTPGYLCDKASGERLPGFDRFVAPVHPARDMTKLDTAYFAKFNSVKIRIRTGPGFLDGPDYIALLGVLETFRAAVIKENETRTHPMQLNFDWSHFYLESEDISRIDQIFRAQRLELARNTIQWHFKFLDKVKFTEDDADIEGRWNFELDEFYPDEADQSGRWFWATNFELGRRGFALVDVVDENESEMSDDEDEFDTDDEDEDIPDLLDGDSAVDDSN